MSLNRRDFLALMSSGMAAGSAMSAFALPESRNETENFCNRKRSPNVVLLICDDQFCATAQWMTTDACLADA